MSFLDDFLGDADASVACGGPRLSARTLTAHAAALAQRLPAASPGSEVTFAFGNDRAAFCVALLATWSRGHTAALPRSARRDDVVPLLGRSESAAFLHDTGVGRGIHVPPLLEEAPRDSDFAFPPESGEPLVVNYAEGSATATRAWTARDLAREVDSFCERLALPAGASVVDLLPPTHPLGFLLGLLVPLRLGGRFARGTPQTVSEAAALVRIARAGGLVATPSRLRALAAEPNGALGPLRVVCAVDEGLDEQAVEVFLERHDARTIDAVPRASTPWRPAFEALLADPRVENAGATRLPTEELEILLVAVAPEESADELNALVRTFDTPEQRHRVRIVDALARDPTGYLPSTAIFLAAGLGRDGRAISEELEIRALEEPAEDGTRRFELRLPQRYAFFEGHFPGYALLAGAVQLDRLVLPCIRAAWPEAGALIKAGGLKFSARISPGEVLEARVTPRGEREFAFELMREETRCSSGRLAFAPRGAPA